MWKNYICESTLAGSLQTLAANAGKAKIIAGGTDLVLELEKGAYSQNEVLIDISRISGLDEIKQDEDGRIHVGPMVTHNHCVRSEIIQKYAPLLAEACFGVGSPQIRNRGTIAGNLITGSPANDTISPLIALDAELTLQSVKEVRIVKLKDFYTGVRKTVLKSDEMVIDISFMGLKHNQRSVYKKYALRKAQAISLVNAAIVLTMDGKIVKDARITLGAVAPTIIHSKSAEAFLGGKELSNSIIDEAAEKVRQDVAPISDIRSSADYRSKIAGLLVRRGLEQLFENTEKKTLPEAPVVLWGKVSPNHQKLTKESSFHAGNVEINTKINGKSYTFKTGMEKSLLHLIREEAGLIGSKEGCGEGECGACTVFLDGVAVMSCLVPAPRADGAEIITIEGISSGEKLHPVQEAFVKEGAVQCGYCTPGFVMSAVKLFEEKNSPDLEEIKLAITGNLCRCTGYYKIVKAIENVAESSG